MNDLEEQISGLTPDQLTALLFDGVKNALDTRILALYLDKGADIHAVTGVGEHMGFLHYATSPGRLTVAKFLIAKGIDIHAKDGGGRTAMHWAAAWGNAELCEILAEAGVNVAETDNQGKTPLVHAKEQLQDPDPIIDMGGNPQKCVDTLIRLAEEHPIQMVARSPLHHKEVNDYPETCIGRDQIAGIRAALASYAVIVAP
ncbi:MAG: ankyrin repeat domain-containing protein [Alphaproteobacteria bacterium]|nr:ankyrin repeat domain-containing protein [Alphaproteobacteria bacterium]